MKIDGKALSNEIINTLKTVTEEYEEKPSLAVIAINPTQASRTYIRRKEIACNRIGIRFTLFEYPKETTYEQLKKVVGMLNKQSFISGIIIQFPIPEHLNQWSVTDLIDPSKDVDGLHSQNQGRLQKGLRCLLPATPQGVLELLHHYGLVRNGMHAVVLGRSPLTGKPITNLLLGREGNMTVTNMHRHSVDRGMYLKKADLIVSAVGIANLIRPDMIKEGCILIDVGINFVNNKMCGDMDPKCYGKAAWYTPVPGGCGPMTVAMLMRNVVVAWFRQQSLDPDEFLDPGWRTRATRTN